MDIVDLYLTMEDNNQLTHRCSHWHHLDSFILLIHLFL